MHISIIEVKPVIEKVRMERSLENEPAYSFKRHLSLHFNG